MTETSPVTIEYGSTEQDCIDVHLFLCLVGGPSLLAPIDAQDSIKEILRVNTEGVIILAKKDGHLIGTLGLIAVPWWYNTKEKFLTNRWFSILPAFFHAGIGVKLEAEAAAIGYRTGLPVVIASHAKRRSAAAPTEPFFMRDHVAIPTDISREPAGTALKAN